MILTNPAQVYKPDYGIFDDFATWLSLRGRRNTTVRKHTFLLKKLFKDIPVLTPASFDTHLLRMRQENYSNSYINGIILSVGLYAQFKGLDPALQHHKGLPKTAKQKATFSDNEIETFLKLPRRKNEPQWHYDKYKMFWKIIAFTGMRPGEVAKLTKGDIDFGRGIICIRTSKTNEPGVVPIPVNIEAEIIRYLASIKTDLLFPSYGGTARYSSDGVPVISNVDWHFDFTKRLEAMKIQRTNLTPYSFRHSYATRLLEEDVSLFHVKKLMRHNRLESTLVYEHLTTKDIIRAQQKLPLIRRGTDPKEILKQLGETIKKFELALDHRFGFKIEETQDTLTVRVNILPQPEVLVD